MRTNVVLDDELMEEAAKYAQVKTKRAVIQVALTEFVESHKRKNLADLFGKVQFDDHYDYKKMRQR